MDIITALDYLIQLKGIAQNELSEQLDAEKLVRTAERFQQVSTVQRIGYLLDEILGKKELAHPLSDYLKTVKHFPVLLRPQKEKPDTMITGNTWKVVKNIEIETDL